MPNLVQQRCFNHAAREAVARCPECSRFFCRECVVEHDGRVVCAVCLKKNAPVPLRDRPLVIAMACMKQLFLAFLVAWFFFFTLGSTLLRLPDEFHETSIWRVPPLHEE